jgi:hypothetical protein
MPTIHPVVDEGLGNSAYVVELGDGRALLVGTVARTDLAGPELTEPLARAAYRSLHQRLLSLPDGLALYPTHGAGSFCAGPAEGQRTTTIGAERRHNRLLAAPDLRLAWCWTSARPPRSPAGTFPARWRSSSAPSPATLSPRSSPSGRSR